MMPDLANAALKATETLIRHQISTAPVDPMPILKSIPGAVVISFAELGQSIGVDRSHVLGTLVTENHDAITAFKMVNEKPAYIVAYNQRLPFYMLQRALARELGHIVLGHDGSRPDDVRNEEAIMFARHMLCPRPLIKALLEAGLRITVETLGNVTGCFERCLAGLRQTPGVNVPAELNRMLKEQFRDYVENFVDFHAFLAGEDHSAEADFGTFMDGYAD